MKSLCECGIDPPGSIRHGVSYSFIIFLRLERFSLYFKCERVVHILVLWGIDISKLEALLRHHVSLVFAFNAERRNDGELCNLSELGNIKIQ